LSGYYYTTRENRALALESHHVLLTFHLADTIAALALEYVEVVAPMAQLAKPPGLPSPLEGILNLAGKAVPVLRLGHLLQLPVRDPGLYSMLIVLKGLPDARLALLVDRVSDVLSVPDLAFLPAAGGESFHACSDGAVSVRGLIIHILSPSQILLEKERKIISEFRATEQWRLRNWEAVRE
jgi:purine-binding chemotaxis protein CheW